MEKQKNIWNKILGFNKFFIASLFILFGIIVFATKIEAQPIPEPCTPDCFETPFETIRMDTFNLYECTIFVWYTFRLACNYYQDLQIVRIQAVGPGCWRYLPLDRLLKTVFYRLIQSNPMGFQPNCPPPYEGELCSTTWRISIAACWITVNLIVSGQAYTISLPCYTNEQLCCLQHFKVCRDCATGIVSLSPLSAPYSPNTCQGAVPPQGYPNYDCQLQCNWFEVEIDMIAPPIDENNSLNQIKTNALENPFIVSNDVLPISLLANKNNQYTVRISDVYGKTIIEQKGKCEAGDNPINVNLKGLKNGTYVYTIIIDGVQVLSNKIILAK